MTAMEPIVPLSAMDQIAPGIDHVEGICVTPDGTLYVSGEKDQIHRVEPDGAATEVATTGGWTLGLAADVEGRIYACDPPNKAVMRWTPGSGAAPEPWSAGAPGIPLVTPNWGTTDGSAVIAFYRPDAVWRWRADLGLQVLGHDPEGTVLAAPTNVVFAGPDRGDLLVPNIGRWHVTRSRVPGLTGTPLFYPTRDQIGD